MKLRIKFNLALVLTFSLGLASSAYLADRMLKDNAREEVIQNSRIMMESAAGARTYTAQHVRPLLANQMKRQFLPESVSAYAAAQSFSAMRTQFPEYTYKEAAINPTNLNDRATDWEADIITEFRNNPDRKEVIVERETPSGRVLNLARPLAIHDEGCLSCHGRPEEAPKTMTDIYGTNNGFSWKNGEVIGAQVVTVPMAVPMDRATRTFMAFIGLLGAVFFCWLVLLNVLLQIVVIRPVVRMAHVANEVSLGREDVPDYIKPGNDEIASLSQSFSRMRLSLDQAMKMLEV